MKFISQASFKIKKKLEFRAPTDGVVAHKDSCLDCQFQDCETSYDCCDDRLVINDDLMIDDVNDDGVDADLETDSVLVSTRLLLVDSEVEDQVLECK